ncbi:hypothetical protein F4821DRAFT_233488 [Hypoxylon rubiginosum]|uniref:Uncharacterized protein n=1 Tax=Hypoxylon rubiginosum TaxID=110542 RepID=A0ACC0D7D4_9PEZI|nr:hypothetical protein F4821DRAFT_233488 [Hypoxylon rubiginosum]
MNQLAVPTTRTVLLSIPPVLVSLYLIYKLSPTNLSRAQRRRRTHGTHARAAPSESSEVDVSASEGPEEEDDDDRPRYEYFCMLRPLFDIELENAAKDESEQVAKEDLVKQYERTVKARNSIEMQPAADHPEHRWVTMWETWKLSGGFGRRASYTNPDFFKMQIYKDFHGEGTQETVENILIGFDKAFGKKRRDENLKQMWAIVAGTMQWLLEMPSQSWLAINNKAKLSTTVGLIGRAFVSVLNELDHAKLLKADSDIKDLGLVMTYYLYWVETLKGRGIELPSRKEVVGYAKKAGIELKEVGLFGTEERVKELEKEGGKIKALSGRAQPDRFDWKKKFKKFSKDYKIGGEKYNILKMTREERAGYALDKKDPLAHLSDKDLQEGNVRIRPRRG